MDHLEKITQVMEKITQALRQIQAAYQEEAVAQGRWDGSSFYGTCCLMCNILCNHSIGEYQAYFVNRQLISSFKEKAKKEAGQLGLSISFAETDAEQAVPELTGFWLKLLTILDENGMNGQGFLDSLKARWLSEYKNHTHLFREYGCTTVYGRDIMDWVINGKLR